MLLYYFGLLFLLFVKRICCFLIYPFARSPYSKGYWVINDHETLRLVSRNLRGMKNMIHSVWLWSVWNSICIFGLGFNGIILSWGSWLIKDYNSLALLPPAIVLTMRAVHSNNHQAINVYLCHMIRRWPLVVSFIVRIERYSTYIELIVWIELPYRAIL